jgi:hypothetical protein
VNGNSLALWERVRGEGRLLPRATRGRMKEGELGRLRSQRNAVTTEQGYKPAPSPMFLKVVLRCGTCGLNGEASAAVSLPTPVSLFSAHRNFFAVTYGR